MDQLAGSLPHLVEVEPLTPYEHNSRTHSRDQIDQIKASIRQFGFVGVLGYDSKGLAIGHGRRAAALEMWAAGEEVWGPGKREPLPTGMLPAIDITGLTDEERRALIIADNKLALNAGWDEEVLAREMAALAAADFELPVIGFDQKELDRILGLAGGKSGAGRMADEFLIPPFSVLNAREGWWQDRKRQWLALGIKSEVGRGENLLRMSDTMLEPDPAKRERMQARRDRPKGLGGVTMQSLSSHPRYYEQKTAAEARLGRKLTPEEFERDHWVWPDSEVISGTSIFDPVLCELVYRWFSPKGGQVLDPFAGGSVRGIVAAALGRRYCGIDLRPEQVEANRAQWPAVAAQLVPDGEEAAGEPLPEPEWLGGDSAQALPALELEADLIFSCPPYGDLEVYSDDPADLSTMELDAFDQQYREIVAKSVERLRPDRFAVFVVGDYRGKGPGFYRRFVSKTEDAFEAAGARLYNEFILVTSVGSLPIRAAKQFRSTRKAGKTHQQVLVFCKGDPRKAAEALGPVDVSAALRLVEAEDGEAEDEGLADEPPAEGEEAPPSSRQATVRVSAACARQMFTTCGPECIEANGCEGNCCDAPTRPSGCLITVNPREQAHIESLGGEVRDGLLQPRPGARGCPFKRDGLCSIHGQGKPFGCVASPFTLNKSGTLIIRNRYRMLPCYKGKGPKRPAYQAFRSSLDLIFGPDEAARVCAHLDAGGGDLAATIDPDIRAELIENDEIKQKAKK